MKSHLAWGRFVVAMAVAAGVSGRQAAAQYAPYRPSPQGTAGSGAPAGVQPGVAPTAQPTATATVPQQNLYQAQQQATSQFPYQPAQQYAYPTTATPAAPVAVFPTPTYPRYPRVAQQPDEAMSLAGEMPQEEEGDTTNTTTAPDDTTEMPGVVTEGHPQDAANGESPYPSTGYYGGGSSYDYTDYGLSDYFDNPCDDTQWFGGIYFLYMERDNPGYTRLTVQANDPPPTDPYYPPAGATVLSSADIDHDFREGVEVRFGSTFTSGGDECGPQGYGADCVGCAPQLYAWEVAFWGIDRDIEWSTVTDFNPVDSLRLYGMSNHAGLEYDPGTGSNPLNIYYDYQMPIVPVAPVDGDVRVLAQRVRTNFRAYNLELNLLKFPVCNVVCGAGDCGPGCEPAACGPAFSMSALCGVRYFRVDDDFELASEFGTYAGGVIPEVYNGFDYASANELYHDIQVENHLVGVQLGSSMNYCIASRWNLFADTTFGLYNNHVNHYQRIYNPLGNVVQFTQELRTASARSDKNDVAFLGEVRLGGSYDVSCHWRAVLAYRAVAISGLALSTEQLRPEYSNWADMARVDSNSSIIIHGIQIGAECRY